MNKKLLPKNEGRLVQYPVYIDMGIKRSRIRFKSRLIDWASENDLPYMNELKTVPGRKAFDYNIMVAGEEVSLIRSICRIVKPFERNNFLISGIPQALDIYLPYGYINDELPEVIKSAIIKKEFDKHNLGDFFTIIDWKQRDINILDALGRIPAFQELTEVIKLRLAVLEESFFKFFWDSLIPEMEIAPLDKKTGEFINPQIIKHRIEKFVKNQFSLQIPDPDLPHIGPYKFPDELQRDIPGLIVTSYGRIFAKMYQMTSK